MQAPLFPQALRHAFVSIHPGGGESGQASCNPAPTRSSGRRPQEQEDAAGCLDPQPPARLATGMRTRCYVNWSCHVWDLSCFEAAQKLSRRIYRWMIMLLFENTKVMSSSQ